MVEQAANPPSPARNYSAFDEQLTHSALNTKLFIRLMRWAKPYRVSLTISALLVIVSSGMQALLPVLQNRVIVDLILVPTELSSTLPDYGLVAMFQYLAAALSFISENPLFAAVVLYVLLHAIMMAFALIQQLLLTSGALRTLRDLRIDLFSSLERKPASFYDHVAVGRVMTRVTNDVENLFSLITSAISHVRDFIPFFFGLFVMVHFSPELTGKVILILPLAAGMTYVFRIVMQKIFRAIRDSVSVLNQYMQENLMGMEVVQLSGREAANCGEYDERNRDNRRQEYRAISYETLFETFNNSLPTIGTALVLYYGGGEVVQNEITLGALLLFSQYVQMMIGPVSSIGMLFNTLFRAMASGERIFQALDWDERLHEPENPVQLPDRIEGDIEFRDVVFEYPGTNETVLQNVSFNVKPGEKLAIVGPTGSGKSTIIRLLARFYDFDDGMIFLDGHDVNTISSSALRRRIGVVLQDFHIFSGTVYENITLNNPTINKERARWAARVVNADSFIRDLPDGYDSELTERGHNLSQGQQQLLAFARVLASDPEVLVLDEATSSIDTGTELIIQDALHRITEGRTSVIIAHRLQTIQDCDRVLVLHHGQIKELGTHEELLALKGIYYTLHELQFQDSQVAAELTGDKGDQGPEKPTWFEEPPDDDSFTRDPTQGGGSQGPRF